MRTNNFKRLEELEEGSIPPPPPEVKDRVQGTMGVFKFVGQIVELYLPKVFDVLVSMVGGSSIAPTGRGDGQDVPPKDDRHPAGPAS